MIPPEISTDSTASVLKPFGNKENLYPSAGPESVLDGLPVDRSVKADAWDAFHAAATPEDFKKQFDALHQLPVEAKASLFDLKFGLPHGQTGPIGPQTPTAPVTPPVNNGLPLQGTTGPVGAPQPKTGDLIPLPAAQPITAAPGPWKTGYVGPSDAEPADDLSDAAFAWRRTHPQLVTPEQDAAAHPKGPLLMSTARSPLPASYGTEPTFEQARGMEAKQVSDAVDENLPFLVGPFRIQAGLIKAAAQAATDPVTGAVIAGSAGLGAVPGFAARGLEAGLSAFFAKQAGKSFLQRMPQVAAKVRDGDWQGAAEEGGGALADAVMAYGAASHAMDRADVMRSDLAGTVQGMQAKYGPAKTVRGTVMPDIDPFQGQGQIGAQPAPATYEGQATAAEPTPAGPAPGPEAKPQPVVNTADFLKAHAVWKKATTEAAAEFMQNNPGTPWWAAEQAVAPSTGIEPTIANFKALPPPPAPPEPPAPPPPPPEPAKPTPVAQVSEATPIKPTAFAPTEPEKPETIALQMQQLGQFGQPVRPDQRRVVMIPAGTDEPPFEAQEGLRRTSDKAGNIYLYRPDLIDNSAIHTAVKNNTLPEVLGGPMGMGAPDKTAQTGPPIAVVARGPDGTEAQTTVTDAANLPITHAATTLVTPPGGSVSIEHPATALAGRQGVQAPTLQPASNDIGSLPPSRAALPEQPAPTTVTPPISSVTSPGNIIAAGDFVRGMEPGQHRDFATDYLHYMTGSRGNAPQMGRPPYEAVGPEAAAAIVNALEDRIGGPKVVHPKIVTPQIVPASTAVTPPPAPVPSVAAVHATDKSVRDLPVRATIANGQVSVVIRFERKPVATFSFPLSEWQDTLSHPNPNYPQRKLAEAKLAATDMEKVIEAGSARNERMDPGVMGRLPDSITGAIKGALKTEVSQPAPAPTLAPAPAPAPPPPAAANPLPARKASTAAKKFGIDTSQYDTKTVEGRRALAGAIGAARAAARTGVESSGEGNTGDGTLRPENRPALEGQLPEGSGGDGETGISFTGSSSGGGPRGAGNGAVRGEGPRLGSGKRTGDAGVGDATGITPEEVEASNDKGETVVETKHPPKDPAVVGTSHEHDYRIPDGRVISGTPERRAAVNIDVLKLLKQLDEEDRAATVDEQAKLAGYVGWGGAKQLFTEKPEWAAAQAELKSLLSPEDFAEALASTMNAHYTGDAVVDGMWHALRRLGAKPGMSWLEPSMGVGTFFGRQPEDLLEGSRRIGVEKDATTAKISKYLYPDSGIDHGRFENSDLPKDYFDFVTSNVPFGPYPVFDPEFRGKGFLTSNIHNYFFAKSLSRVRPGGIVAFITSRYTMDAFGSEAKAFRRYVEGKADLIGAIRLPSGAFQKTANTGVITDIIFLRRRVEGTPPATQPWVDVAHKNFRNMYGSNVSHPVNEYFDAHPEMILGEQGVQRGQFSDSDYDVKGTLTDEGLRAAMDRLPADQFHEWEGKGKRRRNIALRDMKDVDTEGKVGAFFFDKDGNLFRKTSRAEAEPQEGVSDLTKARLRGQLNLRDIYRSLTNAERAGEDPVAIEDMRDLLNKAYDNYVKQHGLLSSRENQKVMLGDPDAPYLPGLERNYKAGNKKEGTKPSADKAPIFKKRLFGKTEEVSPENAKEALSVTLNTRGFLDWDHLRALTGMPDEALQTELAGLVYHDPDTKQWQTADEYLSGSVRTKLRAANAMAKVEPEYAKNVAPLEAVQPVDVPPSRISAILGATWVPMQVYAQFIKETLGLKVTPTVAHFGNEWLTGVDRHPTTKWDTARVNAGKLIEASLNLRRIKVYDAAEGGKSVINPEQTLAAAQRQTELNAHFEKWLFEDTKRGDAMVRIYNDLHNDLRLRTFDGSHLTLPGMSRAALRTGNLEPYQLAAVWRMISQRNVLLNHAPGAGKTYEMIAAGMELKRLGLIQRPMYVVPNSTLGGWQDQFATLYPQARVLVFSETDLAKDKRRAAVARMATGDWDAVVIPHSSFQFIPVGDDIFQMHYNKLEKELTQSIMEAEDAGIDTRIVTRLEKAKERLLTGLQERRNASKQDNVASWEQLGVDQLFVDESHEFKKLGFPTKQPGIAGIDNQGNQKTFDLQMKVNYTQGHGRGVVFASGTPVTNTMGEIHSIMRYLIEPELEARGIARFDDWAAEFGRVVDKFEKKPEGGGYQNKARFAEFVNLSRLATLLRTFTDVMTPDMLDIPRPKIVGGAPRAIITEMNEDQLLFQQQLESRAAAIRSNPRKALPDGMLVVFGDGGKMAMDARMVDASAKNDPEGRLSKVAENVHRLWKQSAATKGTQLLFLDMGVPADSRSKGSKKNEAKGPGPGAKTDFSPYDEIIKKLKELGIPAHDIAHMGQAKNKQQRRELFARVDAGDLRILLGSSQKMGVGVNIQTHGYGLHHIDVAPRPDIMVQREARFIRQGNENPEVHIFYYTTKGTLDENKFGNVVRKGKFIDSLWKGDFTIDKAEDISEGVPSWEMFQAMTSGDPRILRKLEVDSEVDRLSRLQWAFQDQMYGFRQRMEQAKQEVDRLTGRQQYLDEAYDITQKVGRTWVVNGQTFSGEGIAEKVGQAIIDDAKSLLAAGRRDGISIGTAHGLDLVVSKLSIGSETKPIISIYNGPVRIASEDLAAWTFSPEQLEKNKAENIKSKGAYYKTVLPEENAKPTSLIARLENEIRNIGPSAVAAKDAKERNEDEVKTISKDTGQKWPYQADYDKLIAEQRQLLEDLGLLKSDPTAAAMGENEEIVDDSVGADEPDDTPDDDEDEAGSANVRTMAGAAVGAAALLTAFQKNKDVKSAMKAYAAMPPADQKALYRAARDKAYAWRTKPALWSPEALKTARKYFNMKPFTPPPAAHPLGNPHPIQ